MDDLKGNLTSDVDLSGLIDGPHAPSPHILKDLIPVTPNPTQEFFAVAFLTHVSIAPLSDASDDFNGPADERNRCSDRGTYHSS